MSCRKPEVLIFVVPLVAMVSILSFSAKASDTYDKGTRLSSHASFRAALTAIGTTPTTLIVDTVAVLTQREIVPSTTHIFVTETGAFNEGNHHLGIDGKFAVERPARRIFLGDGNVTFSAGQSPIVADWFGSDLYKAYRSATSQSLITFFSNQTTSDTIVMTKNAVTIDGGAGIQYEVSPKMPRSGAMFQLGAYSEGSGTGIMTDAFIGLRNLHIKCYSGKTPIVDHGIEVRFGMNALIENVLIESPILDAIHFNGSPDYPECNTWNVTVRNVQAWYPRRHCVSAVQTTNQCAGVDSFFVDNFVCYHPSDSGVFLYNNRSTSGQLLRADFKDLWLQTPGKHGIESHGWVFFTVNSGYVEMNEGGGSFSHKTFWLADDKNHGSWGIVNNVWVNNPAGGGAYFPHVSGLNQLIYCGDVTEPGNCMTLGNKVSPLFVGGVGPPNQPAKKPGHAVEYPSGWRGRDLYGNEWECTYNARPEGKSPGNKWRATKMPIVLPVTASDINTGTFYVWYPQEEFILTNVMFVNNGYLQCADDTKLSFGTSDNTTVWLSGNNTQINDATTVPWQAKYSSSKLIDKAWRMLSMWSDNDHIGKEDFGANKKYNYIRGYRTGGECAEGSGATIIIEGIYPQHLWNGF